MTTPAERSRSLVFAIDLLKELKDSTKHPETTAETKRAIEVVLRHFPDKMTIDHMALCSPDWFSKVSEINK